MTHSHESPLGPLDSAQLMALGRAQERQGQLDDSARSFQQVIDTSAAVGDGKTQAEALRRISVIHHLRHEPGLARARCHESYDIAVGLGDVVLGGEALNTLGAFELEAGALETSRETLHRALELGWRSAGLRARVEQNLGILANIQGNWPTALMHYERSLAASRTLGDQLGSAVAHHNLGMIHADLKQWDEADAHFRQAAGLAESGGDLRLLALCQLNHTQVHAARGAWETARGSAESALSTFERIGTRADEADALRMLGIVFRETNMLTLAEARLQAALELARSTGSLLTEAEAARDLAQVYKAVGRSEVAMSLLNHSYQLFGHLDAQADLLDVAARMAELQAA